VLSAARELFEADNDKAALSHLERSIDSYDINVLNETVALAEKIRDRNDGRTRRRAEALLRRKHAETSRIQSHAFTLTATINFDGLGAATVDLSRGANPTERVVQEAETLLACLFIARQVANLDDEDTSESIGQTLLNLSAGPEALREFLEVGPGDVRVRRVSTFSGNPLKTGFRATLNHPWEISHFGALPDLLRRIAFKLDVKGFPSSGQGLGWFAPMSALVLLYTVARGRADDDNFLSRLGYAAGRMGALAAANQINVVNQAMPALMTVVTAWQPDDADELWAVVDADEASPLRPAQEMESEPASQTAVEAEDSALRIVRERYARGEISRDEYQQIVTDLIG
jgi:hypothetical protein